jgi:hypothetical protein
MTEERALRQTGALADILRAGAGVSDVNQAFDSGQQQAVNGSGRAFSLRTAHDYCGGWMRHVAGSRVGQ